jgi:acyl-CoA reductase-like NAD-dependent aldehyde dehydrogenase
VLPTVFDKAKPSMHVFKEEIFGPVVVFTPFSDEDDAVELANATPYGLSGSVWTRDLGRALRVAKRVQSGNLSVNSASSVFLEAPFGGVKQSGLGRELGMKAMEGYSEVRNVYLSDR